jgi:PRC-barrel domain
VFCLRITDRWEVTMQNVTSGTGGGQVATDETDRLIASDKVEGTAVYNRQGERLGSVHNFMVDKRSGQVEYAVMSFGGFLGMGGSYHPLPWKALTYDTNQGGYVVDLDKDKLKGAPSYSTGEAQSWGDPAYGRRIDDYYGSGI